MNELLIDLDTHTKASLYEQIYESVRRDIMGGRLSCGERLPSARLLAANLQVSRSTVDAAYAQLVSEGYIQAKRGSGYYVCDVTGLYDFAQSRAFEGNFGRQAKRDTVRHENMKPVSGQADCLYNFLPGQIDTNGFAYNAWRKCAKEALLDLEARQQLLQLGHPQGEYALRSAVCAYLYRARGVRCEPEQIIVGAGNEYLLLLLGQVLGTPRRVAMESPTYLQAYDTFCRIGYTVEAVPMDADGMLPGEIPDTDVSLAYVMPSHQFPLGTVMPLRRRLELLAWAEAHPQRYVIEDDHDSEFRYKGRQIPSLQGMAKLDRVIYLGTFSNSIMPSARVSYMVLPLPLLAAYEKTCAFYASTVSRMQQMTICRFLEQGYFERHLNKMRGIYKGKHDLLLQLLKGKHWVQRIYGGNAGLHIAAELSCALTEKEIAVRAEVFGMRVQGMSECYIAGRKKPDEMPVLLLGFGNLTEKQIREGVAILERCVCDAAGNVLYH
ncbi:MAG: PLP-dependent aminotransferase family protein [Eubacterium sp.]|nr:PLP-dependent aminotransferase family protein [Eubacterium sp.]